MNNALKKLVDTYAPLGRLARGDEEVLLQYSSDKKLAVNLGTFLGRSSWFMSFGARKVYTIDLFGAPFGCEECTFEKVKKTLSKRKNIEVIEGTTYKTYGIKNIDLLFIDGGHKYEEVKKDFNIWFPLVVPTGHIIFHDGTVNADVKDVSRFISSEVKPRKDITHIDHNGYLGVCSIWRKK